MEPSGKRKQRLTYRGCLLVLTVACFTVAMALLAVLILTWKG